MAEFNLRSAARSSLTPPSEEMSPTRYRAWNVGCSQLENPIIFVVQTPTANLPIQPIDRDTGQGDLAVTFCEFYGLPY
jgi:hypothetical protein